VHVARFAVLNVAVTGPRKTATTRKITIFMVVVCLVVA
jgi:hypothetical protein